MPAPPPEVLLALQSGQTSITRRCDIYESDGLTPYALNAKMLGTTGEVTVDYTRDERRNMDITLDNSDGMMQHGPGNLWYDKVVKLFRGIKFTPDDDQPSIAIIDPTLNNTLLLFLTSLGYTDVQVFTAPSVNDVVGFDIVAATDTGTADIGTATAAVLLGAWKSGSAIFTASPYAVAATVPLIATLQTIATQTTGQWNFGVPVTDTPFKAFSAFTLNKAGTTYTMPNTYAAGVYQAASGAFRTNSTNYSGSLAVYGLNSGNGAKWFHFHGPLVDTQGATTATQWSAWKYQRSILITSALNWLFPTGIEVFWEAQVGEFLIDKISTPRAPRNVHITGRDYCKKLKYSDFDNATSFPPGQLIDTLVNNIAENAGIVKFRLGAQGALTTSTNTFDASTSRWDALKSMCDAANIELFFDAYGYLVTRPFLDPTLSPVSLVLSGIDPEFGNLVDWTLNSDDSVLYNRIVVSGISDDSSLTGNIYQGIAENHEPSSPTSIENLGQVRPYYYTSSFFTSNAQCLAYAQTLLNFHALESFEFDYTSLVFSWLEAGEIMEVDVDGFSPTDPTRYLSVSFTIPMTLDPMTGTAKRVTVVG